jgi:hypothetical protein
MINCFISVHAITSFARVNLVKQKKLQFQVALSMICAPWAILTFLLAPILSALMVFLSPWPKLSNDFHLYGLSTPPPRGAMD